MTEIYCAPGHTVMITPDGIFTWDGNVWRDEDGEVVGDSLHYGAFLLEPVEGRA